MSYLTYTQPTKGDHPRIFMSDTNGPTVAAILARTTTSPWSIYWGSGSNSVMGWTTAHVAEANSYFNNYAERCAAIAFRYLMSGTSTYGSKAASIASYLVGLGGQGETTDRENLFGLACIYDWAYDYLTVSQRLSIRNAIAYLAGIYYLPKSGEMFYGHSELNSIIAMIGYAAIMGDSDNSADNTSWRTKFETALDGWEDGTNNSWSAAHSYYGDADGGTFKGAGCWSYTVTAKQWQPRFFAAMKSALALDIYGQNPWYHNLIEWMLWHLGREQTFGHTEGEQVGVSWFPTYEECWFHQVAAEEDNWIGRAAQWLASVQDSVNNYALYGPHQIFRVLWYSTRGASRPTLTEANSGNQVRWFEKSRKACFRTGFDNATDTSFVIAAPPFWGGHSQRGPGHWSLESRGDTLFCRHGSYDPSQSLTYWDQASGSTTETGHRFTYYANQISKNCLRIYDSNEPAENRLNSSQRHISASTYFGIKKTTGEWISNQGGSLWPKTDTAYPYSLADLLSHPEWTFETVAKAPEENSKFGYVVYDLHDSYYSAKLTRYKLHVMWIKQKQLSTTWNDPLILIWYDCTSHIDTDATKGGRKTQTIQLQTQAQMTGTASLLLISRTRAKCWVKTYTPTVLAEFVSGYKDLDGNNYVPTSTQEFNESVWPPGSAPWRSEIYAATASTNPSFLIALAPAAITANVADVPFGTLVDDDTWRGIQYGNYIYKMRKGDTHEAVYEDVSTPIPEPTPPTPPYELVAQAYDSNVNLYWYQTELTGIDHWNVYRRTKLGAGLWTAWAKIYESPIKNHDDGTVVNGTTYQYAVTAVDEDDEESAYSNLSEEVTPEALVPVPTPPPPIVMPPAMNSVRRSVGTSFSMSVLPCPDGSVDDPDQPQASWLYAGITIAAPPVDYSTGSDIPGGASTEGEEISCATSLEGEDLTCACPGEEGESL